MGAKFGSACARGGHEARGTPTRRRARQMRRNALPTEAWGRGGVLLVHRRDRRTHPRVMSEGAFGNMNPDPLTHPLTMTLDTPRRMGQATESSEQEDRGMHLPARARSALGERMPRGVWCEHLAGIFLVEAAIRQLPCARMSGAVGATCRQPQSQVHQRKNCRAGRGGTKCHLPNARGLRMRARIFGSFGGPIAHASSSPGGQFANSCGMAAHALPLTLSLSLHPSLSLCV